MELVRCEDEREDTTLEDRHLLFADLTFGKLSEDFEVREIDDDPDADASGEDSRLEPVGGLTSTVVVEERSLGEAAAVPDSVRLVVKKGPQDEMRDQAVQERPATGAVTNTKKYRLTNTAEYREYRKNILQHGTPEQITAFYRQEAKDKKAEKTEEYRLTNTKEYREYQTVTYSEKDKKDEYRKYIMEHGTPEQIEAFYKIKQAKTYAQDKKAKKEEKLLAMRQRVHVRICIVPTCNNRTDNMDGLNFFLVPRDNVEFRANWEYALSTPSKPYVLPRHGVICQKHFQEDQLKVKQTGKLGLVKGTIPRLELPKDKVGDTTDPLQPFKAPPLFTAKEIKREMRNINPQANCTLEDPTVNLLPSSLTNPQSSEEFEAFGRAIVAKIDEHVHSPFYPSLLKDIMNGLKLGKVVSTKMYDRWLACERKINELNDEIKEYKQNNNPKDIDKKKKYNALLAENCLLKAHKKRHDEQLERVEKKVVYKKDLANYIHDHLKPHLTLSQVKAYLRGDWKRISRGISPEDYQRAKTLLDISPKAYEFLRRTKQLPLPSQSGLREYHSKHSMDLTTQDAVSSIQDAEVLVQSGGKLEQLAHLASSQVPHLSAVTKEPYRCVKCVGGVCDSTGGDCMPPPKKRKRAAVGGGSKKTGGSAVSPKRKKAAAKAQHVVINTAPREIIMHQPQFVHTEVKPSVVYMTPRP